MRAPLDTDPATITGPDDVRAWIAALDAAGLLFHFDDDPYDVGNPGEGGWVRTFTDEEAAAVSALVARCGEVVDDPFAYYPPIDGEQLTHEAEQVGPVTHELVTLAVAIAVPKANLEGVDSGAYVEQVLRDATAGWDVEVVQVDHHPDPDVLFYDEPEGSTLPEAWRS